jgi:hypothetical protein
MGELSQCINKPWELMQEWNRQHVSLIQDLPEELVVPMPGHLAALHAAIANEFICCITDSHAVWGTGHTFGYVPSGGWVSTKTRPLMSFSSTWSTSF